MGIYLGPRACGSAQELTYVSLILGRQAYRKRVNEVRTRSALYSRLMI